MDWYFTTVVADLVTRFDAIQRRSRSARQDQSQCLQGVILMMSQLLWIAASVSIHWSTISNGLLYNLIRYVRSLLNVFTCFSTVESVVCEV